MTWLYARCAAPAMAGHHRAVVTMAARALPHGGRCLDVGCGTGRFPGMLARARPDCVVVGMDPSVSAIVRSRRDHGAQRNLHFRCAPAESAPFRAGAFDLAIATGVIKHCPQPLQALAGIRRVVRSGGSLWLYELDPSATPERFTGLVTGSPAVAEKLLRRFILPKSLPGSKLCEMARAAGWSVRTLDPIPDLPLYAAHLHNGPQ